MFLIKRFTRHFLLFALTLTLFAACDINREKTKQAVSSLESQVNELSNTVQTAVSKAEAPEELKKLQQYEYRIEVFAPDLSVADQTARLNALGKERWECFHIEARSKLSVIAQTNNSEELVVYCKRHPDTPLRYIPRGLIGLAQ